eukprot:758814-Hanusia_phi.AAC.8
MQVSLSSGALEEKVTVRTFSAEGNAVRCEISLSTKLGWSTNIGPSKFGAGSRVFETRGLPEEERILSVV